MSTSEANPSPDVTLQCVARVQIRWTSAHTLRYYLERRDRQSPWHLPRR